MYLMYIFFKYCKNIVIAFCTDEKLDVVDGNSTNNDDDDDDDDDDIDYSENTDTAGGSPQAMTYGKDHYLLGNTMSDNCNIYNFYNVFRNKS